jgi:hypothetical protein
MPENDDFGMNDEESRLIGGLRIDDILYIYYKL